MFLMMLLASEQPVTAADLVIEPGTWLAVSVGVMTLWLLYRQGKLKPQLVAAGPSRSVGLSPFDYGLIFFALLIGVVLTSLLVVQLTYLFPNAYSFTDQNAFEARTPLAFGLLAIMSQTLSNLPVLAVWVLLMLRKTDPMRLLQRMGLTQRWDRAFGKMIVLASLTSIGLVFATNALTIIVGLLLGHPPPPTVNHVVLDQLKAVITERDAVPMALLLISAVILAPLLEELLYRGIVQTAIGELISGERASATVRWMAIMITSLLFIASHIAVGSWHALPALFVLSLVLGWLVERHGKLWPAIVVHMIFNAANIALTFALVLSDTTPVE